MPQVAPQRQGDRQITTGAGCQRPGRPPEDGLRRRADELLAGPELVRQGQADPEVGVEVQQVPRLVAQPPAGGLDAGEHHQEQAHRAAGGEQHARVVDDQVPQGRRGPRHAPGGVPPGDQDDVGEHQVERGEPDQPVEAGQPVLAEGVLQRGHAGHQQHLHEQQHRGHQAGDPAQRGQPGGPAGQVLEPAVGDPPVGDQQEAEPQARQGAGAHGRVQPGATSEVRCAARGGTVKVLVTTPGTRAWRRSAGSSRAPSGCRSRACRSRVSPGGDGGCDVPRVLGLDVRWSWQTPVRLLWAVASPARSTTTLAAVSELTARRCSLRPVRGWSEVCLEKGDA